jgi:hypothetical protein
MWQSASADHAAANSDQPPLHVTKAEFGAFGQSAR